MKTQRDENDPTTISFRTFSNGNTCVGLGPISWYCHDSNFCEGPDHETSPEPIMNEVAMCAARSRRTEIRMSVIVFGVAGQDRREQTRGVNR